MKFFGVITAVTLAAGMIAPSVYAEANNNADVQSVLSTYEQQVGYQRRVILEERKALDQAIANRDNSVHITRDLLNTLAYGVSAGFLTTDFLRGTDNMAVVRNTLFKRSAPAPMVESPVAEDVAAVESSQFASPAKIALARDVGTVAFRATEAVSAVALSVLFVGNVVDTGKDLTVRFKDTDEIRAHRAKLEEARRNLDAADQNLQVAVLSEQQG